MLSDGGWQDGWARLQKCKSERCRRPCVRSCKTSNQETDVISVFQFIFFFFFFCVLQLCFRQATKPIYSSGEIRADQSRCQTPSHDCISTPASFSQELFLSLLADRRSTRKLSYRLMTATSSQRQLHLAIHICFMVILCSSRSKKSAFTPL